MRCAHVMTCATALALRCKGCLMSEMLIGLLAIVSMLVLIVLGMHIGVALIVTSFATVWLMRSSEIAARFVGAAANDAIRDYLFGVVPLFVLMGMFVSVSGVGRDTFDVLQWRSEEHTSELQSLMRISYAVFCLKKKQHLLQ